MTTESILKKLNVQEVKAESKKELKLPTLEDMDQESPVRQSKSNQVLSR